MANPVTEIARTVVAYAEISKDKLDELYVTLTMIFFGAMLVVLIMWGLNAVGAKEVNYVFFFLGIILFAIWAFAPIQLLIAAGAGVAVQGLKDEDLTKGAVKGVTTWYQVTLGVLLWFMITALILAVIPFKARPMAFFPIVSGLLLITVAYASVKNSTVKTLIALAGTGVILYHLWGLYDASSPAPTQGAQPGKGADEWVALPSMVFRAGPLPEYCTRVKTVPDQKWELRTNGNNHLPKVVYATVENPTLADWREMPQNRFGEMDLRVRHFCFQSKEKWETYITVIPYVRKS